MSVDEKWRNYRKELVTPSKNSYIYKLGFRYAISWYNHRPEAVSEISKIFDEPNRHYQYSTQHGTVRLRTGILSYSPHRWYYGTRKWGGLSGGRVEHWAVFKTDADRTLALLTL